MEILEKMKKVKKETIAALFLLGILLIVISWPVKSKKTKGTIEKNVTEEEDTMGMYKKEMEKELTEILSEIEGVGQVSVMITVGDSGKFVVEKDVHKSEDGKEDTLRAMEKDETTVCNEDGQEKSPFVVNTLTPEIQGVFVVAEGGDDPNVKTRILEAVKALFQLESHKISIAKKK